ncbi:MAG TPA: methyltransferase, partial [Legionella sp.]|nr:methyltransferase [Legionella sp.]
LFVFSCEISADEPWHLQDSARFCHHPDYIHALSEQYPLELIYQEPVVARQQEQREVYVTFYIAQQRAL